MTILPYNSEPDEAMKEEAIAVILNGLGEAELRIVASYTTPFSGCLEIQKEKK